MPASSAIVRKTVIYKRARYLQASGNLQEDLAAALRKAKSVGSRKEVLNAHENTCLLINIARTRWKMLFGSVLLYSRGKNAALVTEDDTADDLTIEQLAPPRDESGKRRDFIESLLFFGIKENHVVIMQSMGLRARQFESHLAWLLQTNTQVLSGDDQLELADHATNAAIRQVLKSPIKKVSVGLPLESNAAPQDSRRGKFAFRPEGVGFDVLSTILGKKWLDRMKLDESLDESRLEVEVLVSYTRRTDDMGQGLLNEIASQLRHQDAEDVRIDLANGTRLTGDELKISGPVQVTAYGGLVDPEDLYPRMRDWLTSLLEEGVIDA